MMRNLRDRVERWNFAISPELKDKLKSWIISDSGMRTQEWPIRYYALRMKDHANELGYTGSGDEDGDPLGAGLFCWYGQLLFFFSRYGLWNLDSSHYPAGILHGQQFLDSAFDLSLLYVSFDYYLDRRHIEGDSDTFGLLVHMMLRPDIEVGIQGFKGAIESYKRLVTLRPQILQILMTLFSCEISAYSLQKKGCLNLTEHLNMACDKGGLTALLILCIITGSCRSETEDQEIPVVLRPELRKVLFCGNISQDYTEITDGRWTNFRPSGSDSGAYTLGSIIQLLDDMMDVREDLRDGTSTIATYILGRYGCLDRLWIFTSSVIDAMDDKYKMFKPFTMGILCYILGQRGIFSSRLRSRLSDSVVDRSNNFNMMPLVNSWILKEIERLNEEVEEVPLPPL